MKKLVFFLSFGLFPISIYSQATDPIITLNTSMHTASIRRISADAGGRLILTCSYDKTAKLWDANTGDLLKTFRIPIGQRNEGRLYSCALSPDGSIAAISGSTANSMATGHGIYLFNVKSGKIISLLSSLPSFADDLEFSHDNNYLAAGLHGSNGIRVYKKITSDSFEVYKTLQGYQGSVYAITFDGNGRLASASYDGSLRLYSQNFELIKVQKQRLAGKKPFSIAFSLDGTMLAVAYRDAYQIQVFDGFKLKLLYKPDINGAAKANQQFSKVSFSYDGQYLLAGGSKNSVIDGTKWFQIRIWDAAGQGSYSDHIACSSNGVMDIKPLPDGSIIYCGSPDFGRMDIYGTRLFYKASEINNYNDINKTDFRINDNGSHIAVTPLGKTALSFIIPTGSFQKLKSPVGLNTFTDRNTATKVDYWKNYHQPTINGTIVPFLGKSETCRSTDISADGQSVVFGTIWNIYCVDAKGNYIWSESIPDEARAINIADNNQVLAAALSDGTIRWYRMTPENKYNIIHISKGSLAEKYGLQVGDVILSIDNYGFISLGALGVFLKENRSYNFKIYRNGSEQDIIINKTEELIGFRYVRKSNLLFSLFLHRDDKRWVLWTPEGYYDASVGGEDLIGWHVNQGPDKEAMYYPASQFHEKYYTPNLGSRVLAGEKIK